MKVLFSLLAVVTALSLGITSAAGPFDWKLKKYINPFENELRLTTSGPGSEPDCEWKLPPGGAYVTTPDTSVEPLDWPDWNCQTFFLWAKSCKGAAQTVVFTKKLPYLPGPALDLDVSLVSFGDRPMSMVLEINGSTALSAAKSVHRRDLRGKESLFKVGVNTIEVSARKPKTGAADCNRDRTEYAVYATIRAKFANDFAVDPIPQASGGFQFDLTVTNKGPSRASAATVHFGAYTSNLKTTEIAGKTVAVLITGPGIDVAECVYSYSAIYFRQKSYTGHSTSCPIGGMDPGESATYKITYIYRDPGRDFHEEWPAFFGASGDLFDPKPGNGSRSRMQAACRPERPTCKPPKNGADLLVVGP